MIAVVVICDSCGAQGRPGVGRVDMQKLYDWSFDGHSDYCPLCGEFVEERRAATRFRNRK